MECIFHGKTSDKETPSADNVPGGDQCGLIPNTSGENSAWKLTISFNYKLRQLGPTNLDKVEGLLLQFL